jgi:peptidoglycan/LPS O-acetylase OafA/YrhL
VLVPCSFGDTATLFPFNFPAWSLLCEVLVIALYVTTAPHLTHKRLATIVAATFVILATMTVSTGSLPEGVGSLGAGLARATFGFFAGVALRRISLNLPAPAIPAGFLCLAFVGSVVAARGMGPAYEIFCIAALYPLLIWLGTGSSAGGIGTRLAEKFGYLSYPVYMIHASVLSISYILPTAPQRWDDPATWINAIYVPYVIVLAWIAARWFDDPVRSWLKSNLPGLRNSPEHSPQAETTTTTSPASR